MRFQVRESNQNSRVLGLLNFDIEEDEKIHNMRSFILMIKEKMRNK